MRGATRNGISKRGCDIISTHTPHAGRDDAGQVASVLFFISTHTPHAGRDANAAGYLQLTARISTHTPHAGRDKMYSNPLALFKNFNSHAPCGARRRLCNVSNI